jgi:hypothetical protein
MMKVALSEGSATFCVLGAHFLQRATVAVAAHFGDSFRYFA